MATEEEITAAAEKLLENLSLCERAEANNMTIVHNEDGSVTVTNTESGDSNTITLADAKMIVGGRL